MRAALTAAAALKTNPRVHYQDALNAQREVLILDQTHQRLRAHLVVRKCDMAFWWLQQLRLRLGILGLIIATLTAPRRNID